MKVLVKFISYISESVIKTL